MRILWFVFLFLSSLLYANSLAYTDTFQTNTLSQYTIENTWIAGGIGSFNYDSATQRVHLLTGDNTGLAFSKILPSTTEGSFSIDFLPIKYYPSGGFVTLKLLQDVNTYYKIENTDGYGTLAVSKYVNGVEVDVVSFENEYIQNINYTIDIAFSPTVTTVQAFGETLTINSDNTDIEVNSFSVAIAQQDAYFDNIIYNISQIGENTPPIANAGVDKSIQVNQSVNINGTGTDSDGIISTYVWTKGSTILADTASFSYTPTIEGSEILTLTVTDNNGSTASDDMILTITAEPIQSEEVIIDNSDAAFSTTGTWAVSIATDVYANNSLYSRTIGSSATWTPVLIESGTYEVYVWYSGSEYGNRDISADYTVNYSGGSETIVVNQDQGSGSWALLGTYSFNTGNNGNVTLVSNTNNSRVSIADAVKFVFLDAIPMVNTPPIANAGSDRTVQKGKTITIIGSGSDSDGNIVSYEWKRGNTILATMESFDYTPYTVGTDTLTLTVTDNNGSTASDDMILTITAEPIQSEEVIIDNNDADFSTTGTWAVSIATDVYADNSLYSRTIGSSATWTPVLIESGTYEVYVWYSGSEYGNRDTNAEYTVNYAGGSESIVINQDQGSGAWVLIGTFSFNAGSSGNVTLVSNTNNSRVSIADAVKFVFLNGTVVQNIQFNLPKNNSIQTDRNLISNVWTNNLTLGWGVKFALDEGTPNEQIIIDVIPPYEVMFQNVELGGHKVDSYIVDELQNEQPGEENHDSVRNIAIGDIIVAVGDSITFGYGDDIFSDNISSDGRNKGGGFTPILNDKLSALYGYPHSVINEGVMGEKTEEGSVRLSSLLAQYTEASTFLILYGANDTNIWSNLESGKGLNIGDVGYVGTYKDYLKQMIDLVNNAGKKIAIAKVPFALGESPTSWDYSNPIEEGHRNVQARDFNEAIDELVDDPSNNISIESPNFYLYYKDNYIGKYFDNLHQNGLGYESMADLWKNALMHK